jgi:CRP-like cAMP-binding protein
MGHREPDIRRLLSHLPLFQGMTAGEAARLAAGTTRRALRRGDVLFAQGDRPTGFYVIVFGRIALAMRSGGGRARVVEILDGGRSFGEAIMFLDKPCIVTASALDDTVVLHVARETVAAELERSPAFARRIIAALAGKLEASVRELETHALADGGRRFAAWLLRSVPATTRAQAAVTLPAPKRAIASRLNLSPEHLSRILRSLASGGLIETRGRTILIPDAARLRAWSERGDGSRRESVAKP